MSNIIVVLSPALPFTILIGGIASVLALSIFIVNLADRYRNRGGFND